MTAVIHHGEPGSYKTFSIVQRIAIPALYEGRTVITNIRGLNSLDSIEKAMGKPLPESAQIMHLELNKEGFRSLAIFHHWAPLGALIIMDEAQIVYPLRTRDLSVHDQPDGQPFTNDAGEYSYDTEGKLITRPATVEVAFDMHRHYNWDIYLSTPNIGKVHKEIRQVAQFAYRHKDITGMLNFFGKPKQRWVEFKHNPAVTGTSATTYVQTKKYYADKKIFTCYGSTATGEARENTENVQIFKDPKIRLVLFIVLASFGYSIYNAVAIFGADNSAIPETTYTVPSSHKILNQGGSQNSRPIRHIDTGSGLDVSGYQGVYAPINSVGLHPFNQGDKLYYVGSTGQNTLFELHHDNNTYTALTLDDLKHLGFEHISTQSSFVKLLYSDTYIIALTKPRQIHQRSPTGEAMRDGEEIAGVISPF